MTAPTAAPNFAIIKERQQQVWATGDYAVVGTMIAFMAETLCEAMDLHAGWRVLDVAGGSGNAAERLAIAFENPDHAEVSL